jgi:hypothetical protein
MAEAESTHGLSCPKCGGMVPIPEGQVIVRCPYCDLRSMVRGERGLRRYQVPRQVDQNRAVQAMQRFLSGHNAIARDAGRKSQLQEVFLSYVPFWTVWTRIMSWVFGQKQVGSGDHKHYEAREVRVVQDATWNGAACDVGEFGVEAVPLTNQPMNPFDADALHESGMVFEPVGSVSDARQSAQQEFQGIVSSSAKLDRVAQTFLRFVRQRLGLVYYPLWVLRYLYRGRSFQVVVDGFSGQVLYGKAPGNTLYRAAMLVGGMLVGALLSVDASAIAFYLAAQTDSSDSAGGLFFGGLALIAIGFGAMAAAYRAFRYGEQYEYRQKSKKSKDGILPDFMGTIKEVEKWADLLN